MKRFLEIGKVLSTHALYGELKIYPYCDNSYDLCKLDKLYLDCDGKDKLHINSCRIFKNMAIIKFANIHSIDIAQNFIGKILYVDREDIILDDNTFFIQDIVGCKVYDIDNKIFYGTVFDVSKTGANDVYHIKSPDNKTFLIPVIEEVIIDIDIQNKTIFIKPLKGLFDL